LSPGFNVTSVPDAVCVPVAAASENVGTVVHSFKKSNYFTNLMDVQFPFLTSFPAPLDRVSPFRLLLNCVEAAS